MPVSISKTVALTECELNNLVMKYYITYDKEFKYIVLPHALDKYCT